MAQPRALPASLITGENAAFLDEMYARWSADPGAVPAEWAAVFAEEGPGAAGAGSGPHIPAPPLFGGRGPGAAAAAAAAPMAGDVWSAVRRQVAVAQLINAYRVRGHSFAQIDPLGLTARTAHPELTIGFYGLTEADLDLPVSGRPLYGVPEETTVRAVLARLQAAYCGGFGVEFMNIPDVDKKQWVQQRIETLPDARVLDVPAARRALRFVSDAENFERLLHNRFPGTKRFSVEGAETLVPLLDFVLGRAAALGVDECLLGMAHRGRLNVLANILEKPVKAIVDEFEGKSHGPASGSGDVKYHLGYSSVFRTAGGQSVLMSLAFNPSHLEAVDPVVEGRARARQDRRGSGSGRNVLPLLIHGDAAFAGQGMVAEVLNLSELKGYRTGGTVHVIVNNQIGFTTSPDDARSTPYCTDVARMLGVPIFHVNGEDVASVAAVAQLAAEWRQTFQQDVIIDLYCYRKHGHNEGDEPSFTQPMMYDAIRRRPTPRAAFARALVGMGLLTEAEVDAIAADSLDRLEAHLRSDAEHSTSTSARADVVQLWSAYRGDFFAPVDTRVPRARLDALVTAANTVPEGFHAHRKVLKVLEQRLEMVRGERPVDWAVAEQAAYASLVDAGYRVRLSGQDSGRGTFTHRHAVLADVQTGGEWVGLAHVRPGQGTFEVYDSLLSEAAVLGFEYGYGLEWPDGLVLWEAQFGDFANGAQVIIDNFILSGEQKWARCSGVVMLLPHGYEGQGPEHSSARLERYLQSCAENNVQVANCTTPASFFHLLRRQVLAPARKPLVVMSPKSLLRHPECISTMDELAEGAFQPVIGEVDPAVQGVRRVVLCSGKVYYELRAARRAAGRQDVAIIRLERLYPFPAEEIRAALAQHPGAEVVWCQEEPRNMGAWPMLDEWLAELLGGRSARYAGRPAAASPATGYPAKHKAEHEALLRAALEP